ncbi:hypothetical protein [Scleromatobacter humisilvae]|uniref:Porin domain-containing protein n=1 Tax=Scleromatobacter humisilvae TaxID=2897159 RepID=A0A9X1YKM5_9BURK|nr:hypothetical protein [Scleromatobacter humisilvae]MCK9686107.1 hypothetical protein [Scleromatobacter humisilvae]
MKLTPLLSAALAGACGLASNAAHADATSWDPSWAFSGFGTVGYVETNTDAGLYSGPGQAGGASKEGTLGVDSKLGAQVNAKANNVFSATVQAISQRNGDGNFKPAIEWAFVKAQVTPGLSLRAGRIGAPLFAVSDFRSIGYSNLWLRTPIDVYGQVPFSHFDGGDAIYQDTVGSTTLTAQLFGGKSDSVADGLPVHVKKEVGLNVTAEFDNGITLRVGRVQGKLTVDSASVNGLLAILRTTPFAGVADQMDADDKDASFTGVGAAYDQGNWIANAEFTKRKTSSYVSSTTGWEATLGYRVGKFTPYATVSQLKLDSTNVNNDIPTSVPALAPLAAAVDTVLFRQNLAQKTDSIGMRWDAWKNIDVKAQFDRIKPTQNGTGLFNRVNTTLPSSVNVYSVAVDFVF